MKIKKNEGFTLIELLVVIAIIAILATVVFVALDPVKRFADARDSRRWNDVNNLLTAIHESIVDSGGSLPTGLTTSMTKTQLGTAVTGCSPCGTAATDCVDLATPLATYLKSIPIDPQGTAALTGYSVTVDANNMITIDACNGENVTVQISR